MIGFDVFFVDVGLVDSGLLAADWVADSARLVGFVRGMAYAGCCPDVGLVHLEVGLSCCWSSMGLAYPGVDCSFGLDSLKY